MGLTQNRKGRTEGRPDDYMLPQNFLGSIKIAHLCRTTKWTPVKNHKVSNCVEPQSGHLLRTTK
jgi:hypothetical protein